MIELEKPEDENVDHWLSNQWQAVAESKPGDEIGWRQRAVRCWQLEARYAKRHEARDAALRRAMILARELFLLA